MYSRVDMNIEAAQAAEGGYSIQEYIFKLWGCDIT